MHIIRVLPRATFLLAALANTNAWADDPVVILSPSDGSEVPPAFKVTISFGEVSDCGETGCSMGPAQMLQLQVDDMVYANCFSCCCEAAFDVALMPGPHRLQAFASYNVAFVASDYVNVVVSEQVGTTGSATTMNTEGMGESMSMDSSNASDGGSSTNPGATDSAGATSGGKEHPQTNSCVCSASGSDGFTSWSCLALLAAGLRRRKAPTHFV